MLFVDMLILKYVLIRITRTDEFVSTVPNATHTKLATQVVAEPMTNRITK